MEFLNELWHNQPNTAIGLGLVILVMLGIYIKLLDIYRVILNIFQTILILLNLPQQMYLVDYSKAL